jgi:oligopeptidase B
MSIESASAEAPGKAAVSTAAATTAAPVAQRIPSERTHHGDTFIDEYAWLGDKDNPETIAYLEAENAYVEAATAGQADLRTEIFGEIKARTQETDLSVPSRKGGWWYYSRTEAGKQYAMQCRREVRPGDAGRSMARKCSSTGTS